MSKQVLDVQQMQHLQELELDTSNASMCWVIDCNHARHLKIHDLFAYKATDEKVIPAFTLQDILDLLPYKTVASYLHIGRKSFSGDILFYVEYSNFGGYAVSHFRSESLIEAAYEMLCWCIENGHVKTNKSK